MMSMIVVLIDHKHDVAFIVQLIHTNRRVLLIPSSTFWYDVVMIKTNESKTKSDDEIIPSCL